MNRFAALNVMGLALASCVAQASVVSFASTSGQSTTYFAGQVQQSVLSLSGNDVDAFMPSTLDLKLGVPVSIFTQFVTTNVGHNDGSFNTFSETHAFVSTFTIGGQQVLVSEDVTFKQIANNQFQLDVAASTPKTVTIPSLGTVALTFKPSTLQMLAQTSGGGQYLSTTFVLTSAVPEASPLVLASLGLLPVCWMVRRRPVVNLPG